MLEEKVTESEIEIWPELQHDKILSLNDVYPVSQRGTLFFFMDKHKDSLESLDENE